MLSRSPTKHQGSVVGRSLFTRRGISVSINNLLPFVVVYLVFPVRAFAVWCATRGHGSDVLTLLFLYLLLHSELVIYIPLELAKNLDRSPSLRVSILYWSLSYPCLSLCVYKPRLCAHIFFSIRANRILCGMVHVLRLQLLRFTSSVFLLWTCSWGLKSRGLAGSLFIDSAMLQVSCVLCLFIVLLSSLLVLSISLVVLSSLSNDKRAWRSVVLARSCVIRR